MLGVGCHKLHHNAAVKECCLQIQRDILTLNKSLQTNEILKIKPVKHFSGGVYREVTSDLLKEVCSGRQRNRCSNAWIAHSQGATPLLHAILTHNHAAAVSASIGWIATPSITATFLVHEYYQRHQIRIMNVTNSDEINDNENILIWILNRL